MKFHSGYALLALSLLVVMPPAHANDKDKAATRTKTEESHHTAADMTALYYDDADNKPHTKDCGGAGGVAQPAFFCSGVLIRPAKAGPGHAAWQPTPAEEHSGGMSFSWLRSDAKFQRLASGDTSGITLYPATGPYSYTGTANKFPVHVRCAFPIDGATRYRGAPIGCGQPTNNQPDGGKAGQLCQEQGITTAQEWYAHFLKANGSGYSSPKLYICAFDLRSTKYPAADAFNQMIGAIKLLGNTSFYNRNELQVEAWRKDEPAQRLPIQSFFYIGEPGSQAWKDARTDQAAYYAVTKEFVPVIRIKTPVTPDDNFSFHFYSDDQGIPIPTK